MPLSLIASARQLCELYAKDKGDSRTYGTPATWGWLLHHVKHAFGAMESVTRHPLKCATAICAPDCRCR